MSDAARHDLPGAELIRDGVRDLLNGRATVPALVVSVARQRLARAGVLRDSAPVVAAEPERELYRLLLAEGGDAYSRYNALMRELASFVSALDARSQRAARRAR